MSAVNNTAIFPEGRLHSVNEVQIGLREIDMALFPKVRNLLGDHQTYAYTYLGACCAFLDSPASSTSVEIQRFAKEIVSPAVENCFKAIAVHGNDLSKSELKLSLLKILDTVQFYPKKVDFQVTKEDPALKMLAEQNLLSVEGTMEFYKVKESDAKYYGCLITIPSDIFAKIITCFEVTGHRSMEDKVGSTASGKGHVSAMEPAELAQSYEKIMQANESFGKEHPVKAKITFNGIKKGAPQSGRLASIIMATVAVDILNDFRQACGLGPMRYAPHMSMFSTEIQPLEQLRNVSIQDLAAKTKGIFTTQLAAYFEAYQKKLALPATVAVPVPVAAAAVAGAASAALH